jgi:hypothetical protein
VERRDVECRQAGRVPFLCEEDARGARSAEELVCRHKRKVRVCTRAVDGIEIQLAMRRQRRRIPAHHAPVPVHPLIHLVHVERGARDVAGGCKHHKREHHLVGSTCLRKLPRLLQRVLEVCEAAPACAARAALSSRRSHSVSICTFVPVKQVN